MNEIWDRREFFPAIGGENRAALIGKDSPVRGKLSSAGFGLCPELAVTGVTEAGQDIAVLIQPVIDRGQVDRDIGMCFMQVLDAFRCADQPDKLDLVDAPFLEDVHGSDG